MPEAVYNRPMTLEEDEPIAADALGESVLVVGGGAVGTSVASRIAESDVQATDDVQAPDAVVLAIDASALGDGDSLGLPSLPEAVVRIAVLTVPDRPPADERTALETLRNEVDAVVLASGNGADDLADAVATLVSIVGDSGIVNVDLADVQTVFRDVDLAALCVGNDSIDEPTDAVADAIAALPRGVETDSASGVLVDLIGPPDMSVADVNAAVSTVRDRVGPEAHVIWGGAVDPASDGILEVRLVFAAVESVRASPGDECPRCGDALSTYSLGEREMVSCDSCGFAGVSVRLRD